MKKHLAMAIATILMAGTALAFPPSQNRNQQRPNMGSPATQNCGVGNQSGNRNGKKLGPQDGSGPIHTPGTGGGTGAGTRRGRK